MYLETGDVKKRLSSARALSGNLHRKLKSVLKDLNAKIQGIETKVSLLETCVSTRNSDLENLKQEMTRLEEVLRVVQEIPKRISENQREFVGKSFEPKNIALDETTERCGRTQQIKFGLTDRTKKDDGQKNGESQTREAATMDEVKKQPCAMVSWYCIKLCEPRHISTLSKVF